MAFPPPALPAPPYTPPVTHPLGGGGHIWIDFPETKPNRCIFYKNPFPTANINSIPLGNSGIRVPFSTKDDVLKQIVENKCCEVIFAGHQGGEGPEGNEGGVLGMINCNPYDGFGKELAKAFSAAGCNGCSLILAACGTVSPSANGCRQQLSDDSGCGVFASPELVPYYDPKSNKINAQGSCTFDKRKFGQPCPGDWGKWKPWPFVPYYPSPMIK